MTWLLVPSVAFAGETFVGAVSLGRYVYLTLLCNGLLDNDMKYKRGPKSILIILPGSSTPGADTTVIVSPSLV